MDCADPSVIETISLGGNKRERSQKPDMALDLTFALGNLSK
jgi:hypothetical protein